jgi:multidrug efflux pump subunit AcrA (membrane-fusion protein)
MDSPSEPRVSSLMARLSGVREALRARRKSEGVEMLTGIMTEVEALEASVGQLRADREQSDNAASLAERERDNERAFKVALAKQVREREGTINVLRAQVLEARRSTDLVCSLVVRMHTHAAKVAHKQASSLAVELGAASREEPEDAPEAPEGDLMRADTDALADETRARLEALGATTRGTYSVPR